jgi:predicted transcriptional regulator
VRLTAETGERLHHYDEPSRTLFLSTRLRPGQRAFRMATQLALLEYGDELDRQAGEDFPPGSSARDLARIGIANYFAAALILPYTAFHSAAEEVRYDIERLTDRYGLGYETVCHRLSTLQRPRLRGVPFSFVRVDRAGNLSKRQSATGFHFSRAGGTCPLWNVYEAFAAPGRIHVQIAEMPTGSVTSGRLARSPGTAAAGANPARPSPSVSAARSVTPTASSTPTASTCPAPPPPPPSAWAAASANASTAPSAPHRHSASPCGSTRTPARSSRIQ